MKMEKFKLEVFKPDLDKKISDAIRILKIAERQAEQFNEPVEIAFSGGKDSSVLLDLAKKANINFRAIYKNTTIDPVGTKKFVMQNNVEIRNPKMSFFKLIEKKGYPSFNRRFCCASLKEYKILNVCCTGVRKSESVKRKNTYKSFESCRIYNKKERVRMYYPILEFTNEDIKNYINRYNIQCAPIYYDDKGVFHVERRLGCIGCPLQSDRGKQDFKENPKILRAWLKAGGKYIQTHKLRFNNEYEAFLCAVFFKSYDDYLKSITGGIFEDSYNAKQKLQEYFNIKF